MIGEQIHNYKVNAHLGQGGMGTVLKATDMMLGREVALKMLHPQLTIQPQFLERFKKEARVLAQLHHPNIAVIYNFIEQGGNYFMVMEYVEGTNLDEFLRKYKVLPTEFVVPVFIQALEGLQHAHRKNVFHRDIKPSNLMLGPDGTVKLMDFGIAKVAGEQKMTQVNKIVGTVEFMAPELIQGQEASAASDIYAMGATLYELISGKLPFESDTDFNLMQAILKKKVNPPVQLNNSIPRALSDIVMKALDKKPGNRFTDARAFQQALIMAFPHFREINMSSLKEGRYTTQPGQHSPVTGPPMTAVAMETRVETSSKPVPVLEVVKQKIIKNKKRFVLSGAATLFIAVILIWAFTNKGAEKEMLAKQDSLVQKNSIQPVVKDSIIHTPEKTEAIDVPPVKKNDPVISPPVTRVIPKEEEKKKEEVVPVVIPAEKKDVYIKNKLEVSLYLRENLSHAPYREDIPVTFKVTQSVVYEGATIINQGAIAYGTIKLRNFQTDIEINSVKAANGQQIRLRALRAHGGPWLLSPEHNYLAIIEPGIRLSF